MTYIHASYQLPKCWQGANESGVLSTESIGARWIIAHAGGKNGFIPNGLLIFKSKTKSLDYHDDMNAQNFMRWMEKQIIPNLEPNSIIVMDNASYHTTQINKVPTLGSLKSEMQTWLKAKGLYFEESWTKPHLYETIKNNKGEPEYKIKHVLKHKSHELVRLPPYHYDLNPIEKIWATVKRRVVEKMWFKVQMK